MDFDGFWVIFNDFRGLS